MAEDKIYRITGAVLTKLEDAGISREHCDSIAKLENQTFLGEPLFLQKLKEKAGLPQETIELVLKYSLVNEPIEYYLKEAELAKIVAETAQIGKQEKLDTTLKKWSSISTSIGVIGGILGVLAGALGFIVKAEEVDTLEGEKDDLQEVLEDRKTELDSLDNKANTLSFLADETSAELEHSKVKIREYNAILRSIASDSTIDIDSILQVTGNLKNEVEELRQVESELLREKKILEDQVNSNGTVSEREKQLKEQLKKLKEKVKTQKESLDQIKQRYDLLASSYSDLNATVEQLTKQTGKIVDVSNAIIFTKGEVSSKFGTNYYPCTFKIKQSIIDKLDIKSVSYLFTDGFHAVERLTNRDKAFQHTVRASRNFTVTAVMVDKYDKIHSSKRLIVIP